MIVRCSPICFSASVLRNKLINGERRVRIRRLRLAADRMSYWAKVRTINGLTTENTEDTELNCTSDGGSFRVYLWPSAFIPRLGRLTQSLRIAAPKEDEDDDEQK